MLVLFATNRRSVNSQQIPEPNDPPRLQLSPIPVLQTDSVESDVTPFLVLDCREHRLCYMGYFWREDLTLH